jgi:hypothetical protein
MRQLTYIQAHQIAAKVADKSTGFTPIPAPTETIKISGADLRRILEQSAFLALIEAGCLEADQATDLRRINRLADAATRRHDAFRKATGRSC